MLYAYSLEHMLASSATKALVRILSTKRTLVVSLHSLSLASLIRLACRSPIISIGTVPGVYASVDGPCCRSFTRGRIIYRSYSPCRP